MYPMFQEDRSAFPLQTRDLICNMPTLSARVLLRGGSSVPLICCVCRDEQFMTAVITDLKMLTETRLLEVDNVRPALSEYQPHGCSVPRII